MPWIAQWHASATLGRHPGSRFGRRRQTIFRRDFGDSFHGFLFAIFIFSEEGREVNCGHKRLSHISCLLLLHCSNVLPQNVNLGILVFSYGLSLNLKHHARGIKLNKFIRDMSSILLILKCAFTRLKYNLSTISDKHIVLI